MENKIILEVEIPLIEKKYEVFVPVGKSMKKVMFLIQKSINQLTNGEYQINEKANAYFKGNGNIILQDKLVKETGLQNGSKIVIF